MILRFRAFSFKNKNIKKSFEKPRRCEHTVLHWLFVEFGSILTPFWKPTWAVLGRLGNVLGHLGPSWRPLGGLLSRLGSLLGPLGGQDPPGTRGICFWEASWGRLGLIFGRFLDGFLGWNFNFCSTGEPLEAFQVEYFYMNILYFRDCTLEAFKRPSSTVEYFRRL